MDVVANYPNWKQLVLSDRTILREDLRYMSWEQIKCIDQLPVALAEDQDITLIIGQ